MMAREDLEKLLSEYRTLPEYEGLEGLVVLDVNQVSAFGDRPIHVAAVRGAVDELSILYENGADLNSRGEYGYTPLHHAVEQGHIDAVSWLIATGTDCNLKDDDGFTALDIAETLNRKEIVDLLKNVSNKQS